MKFTNLKAGRSVLKEKIPAFIHRGNKKDYLYLFAGIHGDEVEGVFVLEKLFQWLQESYDHPDLALIVIPAVNIDGIKQQTRVNANGVDLNRNLPTKDWSLEYKKDRYCPGEKSLSEPENLFLVELFKKYPPRWVVSFHTWKPLLNFNGDGHRLADFLHPFNHYPISETMGYPTPGSMGTYLEENYNCGVLTFECPEASKELTLEKIWRENEKGLKALMLNFFASKDLN